jgi:predicted MFS family arabinose efflux permease
VPRLPRLTQRRTTLLLVAAALAVDYGDRSVVGAVGPQLKQQFDLGNAGLGVVASAFAGVGAIATVPAGALVDRVSRVRLLAAGLAFWSAAMTLGGAAVALWMFVGARMMLGALVAVARPAAASLVGDLYPPSERNRALSVVDAGELVGTGGGVVVAALVGAFLSWRAVFWIVAAAGAALAFYAHRVEEPKRRQGGRRESLAEAFRIVLTTRTVVIVIVASCVGYFFFAGVRTFAVTFTAKHYGVSQSLADLLLLLLGLGAAGGLFVGGRIGDHLTEAGRSGTRLVVAAAEFAAAAGLFALALFIQPLALAMPLYVAGAATLTAASPMLDAIRLDVVAPDLWGRAESVRTTTQIVFEAVAPLGFGIVADALGGSGGGRGLQLAFLVSLPLLLANGLILLLARKPLEREGRET